jgi:phospholipid/cholesterol/gamma-HCH transport system substrate-binding protein
MLAMEEKMERNKYHFSIGLFLIIGFFVTVGMIAWLGGAERYFEKGKTYVIFFDESVEGLLPESSVNYQGVRVGEIRRVSIAPDRKLIMVEARIYQPEIIQETTVAQLTLAGIAGGVYVNLYQVAGEDSIQQPEIAFAVKHPIIPSQPSDLQGLMADAKTIIRKISRIDFLAITEPLAEAMEATRSLMAGDQMKQIMARVAEATAELEQTASVLKQVVSQKELSELVAEMKGTLVEARSLLENANAELGRMKVVETTERAEEVTDQIGKQTNLIALQMREVMENLRQASRTLNLVVERVYNQPSQLFFSNRLPPRRGER